MGLQQNVGFWKESNYGKGVIIGVLDSGILPNHPSFSDEGMPSPPAKWKGVCEFQGTSACNNKIIGARSFLNSGEAETLRVSAPIDQLGHGTHTASTAAGSFVKNTSVFRNGNGTAVGIAPYAHLAIYQVCGLDQCAESDVLAGLDAAIEDGVDVLSISLAVVSQTALFYDPIAMGTFSAMQKGIFTSCSAGNAGPGPHTVANAAPWILSVGASSTNRNINATLQLGNGTDQLDGEAIFWPKSLSSKLLPLAYPNPNSSYSWGRACADGSLDHINVKGKIVVCERSSVLKRVTQANTVQRAGGAAMVLMNQERQGFNTVAEAHGLPSIHVSYAAGLKIISYLNSTTKQEAKVIFKGTSFENTSAPMVASFSSRGPCTSTPGILKPDIIGPGVSILAAWPYRHPLDQNSNTEYTFKMMSGTSMSCPHLSGIAALLKSSHPDWSPAVIKSAIMTTANPGNLKGRPILDERLVPANLFAIGAGHVNPSKANDPGLVYDIKPHDYISYLCGLNYTNRHVGLFLQGKVNCSKKKSIPEAQLNYPSFSIQLGSSPQNFTRQVTNVGEAYSSYTVKVVPPLGVTVSVEPNAIKFTKLKQKETYSISFRRTKDVGKSEFAQGYLKWISDRYSVRSPISISFV